MFSAKESHSTLMYFNGRWRFLPTKLQITKISKLQVKGEEVIMPSRYKNGTSNQDGNKRLTWLVII